MSGVSGTNLTVTFVPHSGWEDSTEVFRKALGYTFITASRSEG